MNPDLFLSEGQITRRPGATRLLASAVAAAVGLLALAAPSLRATPVYAGLGFGVSAGQIAPPLVFGNDNAAWGVLGSPLSVSATATAGGATAFGSAAATWAPDGNSGTVVVDYGWSITGAPGVGSAVGTGNNGPNWEYGFFADATGDFVLNYNVTGTGETTRPDVGALFGLQGFRIGEHRYFDLGYALVDDAHPSVSGQYVFAVTQGNYYDFQFVNLGNLNGNTIRSLDASVHGEFSWTLPGGVSTVPESSSSVVLLGLGLGGLVLSRRRLRRIQTA